MAELM